MSRRATSTSQLDLFAHVAEAYLNTNGETLHNDALYCHVATSAGLTPSELTAKVPIGRAGVMRSPIQRKIRWHQQSLKALGVIEHVPGQRGLWRLTHPLREGLNRAQPDVKVVAFSTDLGVAIWGSCFDVFPRLQEAIMLCVTSPPYPLREPRAYGNPSDQEYVDFICRALEPIIDQLAPGGSLAINLSNDIFLRRSPGRSLYRERLVLALCERFGLVKMDELIWHNPSKPPGPVQWASKRRVQLNTAWEPIYWFTNDPLRVKADNRRVLEAHTERHLKLITRGGEQRHAEFGDGAYRIKPGDYSKVTAGRIPRNVLTRGHTCPDNLRYRADARELEAPLHGAAQPLSIPDFLIRFLTEPGDLVVDPFGGTLKSGRAAESLGRRWLVTEWVLEYIRAAAVRFRDCTGFCGTPGFG